jgi:hypothetical protein
MKRESALLVLATLAVVLSAVNLMLLAYLLAFVRDVHQVAEAVREFVQGEATMLDSEAVERDVAVQFAEREGVGSILDCPKSMPVEVGATYECTGTTDDGEEVTLVITVTDEETVSYTWTER